MSSPIKFRVKPGHPMPRGVLCPLRLGGHPRLSVVSADTHSSIPTVTLSSVQTCLLTECTTCLSYLCPSLGTFPSGEEIPLYALCSHPFSPSRSHSPPVFKCPLFFVRFSWIPLTPRELSPPFKSSSRSYG